MNAYLPSILTHPHIPKPLHGIAPQTIKGLEWWDEKRVECYAKYDFHCAACGRHQSKTEKKWLEAHENYQIDYEKGLVEILSIEPLCHYCHNFIHSGRLRMIAGIEKTFEEVRAILEHGLRVLLEANIFLAENDLPILKCFYYTYNYAANKIRIDSRIPCSSKPKTVANWSEWRMIFEGKEYKSNFKDANKWRKYYANK